jgi:hypothetical protein
MVARVVVDRANEDHLVGMFGVQRQRLGNVDAGNVGLDGSIRPAILGRRIRLGVVSFQLAGPAIEPEQDDRRVLPGCGTLGPKLEQIGQRQSRQSQEPGLERTAPRHSLAIPGPRALLNLKHRFVLTEGGRRRWAQQHADSTLPGRSIGWGEAGQRRPAPCRFIPPDSLHPSRSGCQILEQLLLR